MNELMQALEVFMLVLCSLGHQLVREQVARGRPARGVFAEAFRDKVVEGRVERLREPVHRRRARANVRDGFNGM